MRDDRERLRDMLEALERIEKYTALGQQAFEQDELVQTWIVHHLEIVGEAMRGLSDAFRERHPELPWSPVIGMRNVLIHGYFQIDLALVWTTVVNDVPELRQRIEAILTD